MEQDLVYSKYPNQISYFLTQFGIIFTSKVFYANFFYELFGQVKDNISIHKLFGLDDPINNIIDLGKFPTPPDSMVKYIYQLKLAILLKTAFLMMVMAGFSSFLSTFFRKLYYYYVKNPSKLFKSNTILQTAGCISVSLS